MRAAPKFLPFFKNIPSASGRGWIALTVACGFAGLAATTVLTALIGHVIDAALHQDGNIPLLIACGALVVFLRAGLSGLQRLTGFRTASTRKNELRKAIYRKLLALGPDHVKSERAGAIVNECTEGVEALDAYHGVYVPQLVVGLSAPLLICGYLAGVDWVTGLALFAAAPIPPLLLMAAGKRFRSVSRRYYAAMNGLSALFLDSVHGLTTLKLFGRGGDRSRLIRKESESLRRETMRLLAANQILIFLMDWGFAISTTIVAVVVGRLRWKAGAITEGGIVVAILLGTEIVRQINLVAAFFFAGAGGRAVLKKIHAFLALPPAVVDSPHAAPPSEFAPSIRFDHVCFRYDPNGTPVLDDVSFEVSPGEIVGIVGPSGSGKTTILNLLLRFADPEAGDIRISGKFLRDLPVQWLRQTIALVAQDPHLFHGTVLDNLRMACPAADRERIEAAARAANLHDFVLTLPQGYDTPIGERAVRLSGGQVQRLAIARAFLQDAPILVLDEATANLDAANESVIGAALRKLRAGRTTLIVAHRQGALREVDRMLVLHHGRISPLAHAETPSSLLVT